MSPELMQAMSEMEERWVGIFNTYAVQLRQELMREMETRFQEVRYSIRESAYQAKTPSLFVSRPYHDGIPTPQEIDFHQAVVQSFASELGLQSPSFPRPVSPWDFEAGTVTPGNTLLNSSSTATTVTATPVVNQVAPDPNEAILELWEKRFAELAQRLLEKEGRKEKEGEIVSNETQERKEVEAAIPPQPLASYSWGNYDPYSYQRSPSDMGAGFQ